MFPPEVLVPDLAAVLVVVVAPGPDNILAIGRGLSQGRAAAALSSIGAGLGITFHTVAAALVSRSLFIPQFVSAARGPVRPRLRLRAHR